MDLTSEQRSRLPWLVVGVAVAVPLLLLALSDRSFVFARDTPGYWRPGVALFRTGSFLINSTSVFPEMDRTPVYPLLVGATSSGDTLHPLPMILLQVAMRGLLILLILTFPVEGRIRGLDWRRVAAVFVATDLLSAAMSLQVLPETLSSVLLVLASWLYCAWRREPTLARLAGAGLIAGVAALTKPINLVFLPLLLALTAFDAWRQPRRTQAVALATMIVTTALLPGAWVARNCAWSGHTIFSTITSRTLLYYRAGGILAAEEGKTLLDVGQLFAREEADAGIASMPPWEIAARRSSKAWSIIRRSPLTSARLAVGGLARSLAGPGVELWNELAARQGGNRPRRSLALLLTGATALHLFAFYAWAAVGWARAGWRRPPILGSWCLVVFAALLAAAAGPESYSRFRVPVMPFLALSAAVVWAKGGRVSLARARPVPLRVTHVVTTLLVAGAERFAVDLAIAQRREGADASVVAMYAGGPLVDVLRAAGVRCEVITRRGKYDVRAWLRLIRVLRELDPEIVHVHDVAPIVRGVPAVRLACRAPIVAVRHDVRSLGWARDGMLKLAARAVSVLVASSQAVRTYLLSAGEGSSIPVIYCGIDTSRFSFLEPRAVIAPRLVTAGRLDPTKGHDILIEATARLLKEWPDVSLTILGEGACRPDLAALAGTLGITDRVRFAGVTPRPEPWLAQSDVFCFPSRSEAQGLALIEAQAAGLPVVASAVGGILETVAPDETGLLVEPGNAAALADAIARLGRDHELRSRLATTARERVGRWDVGLAAHAYLALYEDVLGAGAHESGAAARPGSARA